MFKDIFIAEHLRMTASESFGNIKVNLNGYIGYIHLSSLCLLISQEESFQLKATTALLLLEKWLGGIK